LVKADPAKIYVAAKDQPQDTDNPFHFVLGNREIIVVEATASEVVHFDFKGIRLFFEIHNVPVTVLAYERAVQVDLEIVFEFIRFIVACLFFKQKLPMIFGPCLPME
jgi:hypothetical protein